MRKFLKVMLFVLIGFVAVFAIAVISFSIINHNLQYEMPVIANIELYDNSGEKYLSVCNNKKQSYVTLDKISLPILQAFVTVEDKRFFEHPGVDFIRIAGALLANIRDREFSQGASTITQQYIKNVFLSHEKTVKRKLYEAMIAINFENKYSKEEILEGYLNTIYFDHGIYGIEDASLFYFNKHASEINLIEACALASIPKSPGHYSPLKNPVQNKTRRNLILNELLEEQVISEEEYLSCYDQDISVVGINQNTESVNAPYFQDLVLRELQKMPWLNDYAYKGLKVYTTLDRRLNTVIQQSLKNRLPDSDIEVAIYVMNPKNGHVLNVIGGKDYLKSSYNRATDSVRQPGSAIKPFLYLTALENGFTQSTTFLSEPTTFYLSTGSYSPKNFQSIYPHTHISMVYAIATSDNIYAMKTHLFLGEEKMATTLKRFGFSGDIPAIPSLALGTYEVSLQELTQGYATLANLGVQVEPTFITKVTTFDGLVLYEKDTPEERKIAHSANVFLLNQAMTSTFDNRMTYNIRPTGGRIASLLNHTVSGKSGTTDTDNWMMGFNPDVVVGVWTGYDDNRPIENYADLNFGKYLWADIIEGYLDTIETAWYETPDDVISVYLNPMTGFYPGDYDYTKPLYFRTSNIPWYIRLLYQ
ncbi:MAG: penicillin-binding protein [Acholeplasmataceae bacterium]|nr:penicillin-binding protein [Acholeplasmataceae bacterium]